MQNGVREGYCFQFTLQGNNSRNMKEHSAKLVSETRPEINETNHVGEEAASGSDKASELLVEKVDPKPRKSELPVKR